MSSKKVLVPIADGSEEIETACITDTLTHFGAEVTIASVMGGNLVCKMSRGMKVMADISIEDAAKEEFDCIVLPGGMPGAEHLRDSEILFSMLEKQKAAGKLYAAICAAPAVVLASHGLLDDIEGATCYPAEPFRQKLVNPTDDAVAVTGNVITSKGPGTSLAFALELGEQLFGKEIGDKIQKEMLVQR
ncbi:DJ-1 family protein [Fragilariopsis cylindrus CCMP1102]|uniref:DJ-1 family protein n=1 Tax=Fragilariopsis cylindrus CCMP1102 TaxID=635003 RepID=A0A1E7FBN9_9STRA|nr:DJ-1 family protein [Fragilariopsis cylindrus CCMP1102]|eukprot:OEU15581.1 DJ-1 family protein [Fragilariopsis cylindrus CCMP1102]